MAVAEACRPGWIAELAAAALRGLAEGGPREGLAALGEAGLDLAGAAGRGLRALRVLASVATALGLLGAVLELGEIVAPEHGLRGLARGLVERTAIERGLLAMSIGVGTAIVAIASQRAFARAAGELVRDIRAISARLESFLERSEEVAAASKP